MMTHGSLVDPDGGACLAGARLLDFASSLGLRQAGPVLWTPFFIVNTKAPYEGRGLTGWLS